MPSPSRDDAGAPRHHDPVSSPPELVEPSQDVNGTTLYPPTPGSPTHPGNPTRHHVDRALNDLGGRSVRASRPATPIGVVPSNSVQALGYIGEQHTDPGSLSARIDSIPAHQLLALQDAPDRLTTSSYESLGSLRPLVGFRFGFQP